MLKENLMEHGYNVTRVMLFVIMVLFGSLFLTSIKVNATNYYISPEGSDRNSGTYSSPYASITKAQSAASSGNTVYMLGGTYDNFTIENSDSNYYYVNDITKSGITYRAGASTKWVFGGYR